MRGERATSNLWVAIGERTQMIKAAIDHQRPIDPVRDWGAPRGRLCIVVRFERKQDQSAHLSLRLLFDVDTQQVVDERSEASLVPNHGCRPAPDCGARPRAHGPGAEHDTAVMPTFRPGGLAEFRGDPVAGLRAPA
jgi:hypothetical protein